MIRAAVAQVWAKGLPDCRRCRLPGSEALRVQNGCDEPAKRPVWASSCACSGLDAACPTCNGSGEEQRYRCPGKEIGRAAWLRPLMDAYRQFDARHVLPIDGGWTAQAAGFGAFVAVVDGERGWIEEREREREEQRRKRQDNAQRTEALSKR